MTPFHIALSIAIAYCKVGRIATAVKFADKAKEKLIASNNQELATTTTRSFRVNLERPSLRRLPTIWFP